MAVRGAHGIEAVGIREAIRVAIGVRQHQADEITRSNSVIADHQMRGRHPPDAPHRGFQPEHLVDHRIDRHRSVGQFLRRLRMIDQQRRVVALPA